MDYFHKVLGAGSRECQELYADFMGIRGWGSYLHVDQSISAVRKVGLSA
jgi:hypothetical protein